MPFHLSAVSYENASNNILIGDPDTFYIDICRIGDADSFLLWKNRDFMLVDTGRSSDAEDITGLLVKRAVPRLKALVITHYDGDHTGAYLTIIDYMISLKSIANPLTIDHIYARIYTITELDLLPPDRYRNYIKFINGILRYEGRSQEEFDLNVLPDSVTAAEKAEELYGDGRGLWIFPDRTREYSNFTLDREVMIRWLNRCPSFLEPGTSAKRLAGNVNNDSLIFKAYYADKSALFLGDMGYGGLMDLTLYASFYLKSDILKIAHHGHKYSSPGFFVEEVNPSVSFVTTTLDSLPDNKEFHNRLEELLSLRLNFGTIIYSGRVRDSYSTIAVRLTKPQIYTENTSIVGYQPLSVTRPFR